MAFCRLHYSILTVTSQAAGACQGFILSPILYNLYTAYLFEDLPPHVKIVGHADNLGLYSQDKAVECLSIATHLLISRMEKGKIKVNTPKTEALFIADKCNRPTEVNTGGSPIKFVPSVK